MTRLLSQHLHRSLILRSPTLKNHPRPASCTNHLFLHNNFSCEQQQQRHTFRTNVVGSPPKSKPKPKPKSEAKSQSKLEAKKEAEPVQSTTRVNNDADIVRQIFSFVDKEHGVRQQQTQTQRQKKKQKRKQLENYKNLLEWEKDTIETSIDSNGTNADVQCSLGLKCQFEDSNDDDGDDSGDNDMTRAIDYYAKAATQGHLLALIILEYCYREGLGVERSHRISELFKQEFQRQLAKQKEAHESSVHRENNARSFELLEQLSVRDKRRDTILPYWMGLCFSYGIGVGRCGETAIRYCRIAAETGNASA